MKFTKKTTITLSRLLVAAAMISVFSLSSLAYDEDTHFNMTYVICRSVGFTPDEALIVAAVDQGMDDSTGTVANTFGVVPHPEEEWRWHALDLNGNMGAAGILARRDQLFNDALRETNTRNKLIRLGVFFHYQQDTWAHRHHYEDNHLSRDNYTTYNTPLGHGPDLHQPDRPPFDPVAALMNLEDGIKAASRFLKEGLGREPGPFLANYVPQGGSEDSGWSKNGKFFHQISFANTAQNTSRAYLLSLIRTQIDTYTSSISFLDAIRFGLFFTSEEANVNDVRIALEKVCRDFQPFRSAGIADPTINIPTKEQKEAAGFTNLTTAILLAPLPGANSGPSGNPAPSPVLNKGKQVAAIRNSKGLLEVFYVGTDNVLYSNSQNAAKPDTWNGEINLRTSVRQISPNINSDGRLEVFYLGNRGGDDGVKHIWQREPNGSWNGEAELNGFGKQVISNTNANGLIEIFYIGTDNNIYHDMQNPQAREGWAGETRFGGSAKQLTSVRNSDGRLEVVYIGLDDMIYHNWQTTPNGAWSGEALLGGPAKQVAAAANQDGRLEVFFTGPDDSIFHNWQNAPGSVAWNGQTLLMGFAKQISVATARDGRLVIFYVGTDSNIWHNWQDAPNRGAWRNESLVGGSAKQISAISNQDGRLEVFFIGLDDRVYHNSQRTPNGAWTGPAPL